MQIYIEHCCLNDKKRHNAKSRLKTSGFIVKHISFTDVRFILVFLFFLAYVDNLFAVIVTALGANFVRRL